jgi:hypothetical protein
MFANFFARPNENLKRWDETIAKSGHKLIAIGGPDAHSNVGFGLADATGKQLLGVKLDPYERSFRTVRTHVCSRRTWRSRVKVCSRQFRWAIATFHLIFSARLRIQF